MRPKIVVIVGSTASGKSALAIKLAKKFNGEIISADSRQVYRGLNIGTGKVTKKEMAGVPHYLLDIADPRRSFSVARYKKLAEKKIGEIIKRGKLPIVVGGTGFYIQAIVDNVILPAVKPNLALRKKLAMKNPSTLYQILKKLDPRRAKNIDKNNPRRLIRAIEVAKIIGRVTKLRNGRSLFRSLQIGLILTPKTLRQKIRARLLSRLKQGLVAEVRKLHAGGLSWRRLDALGLEYRYVAKYLQHQLAKIELIRKLETAIWRYAKRQLTWFKRDQRIHWIKTDHAASGLVKKFF